MEQQYGSDFISITDEDGKEYELEILSTIEYQGAEYLALVPAEEDEASEELEVSILTVSYTHLTLPTTSRV